MKSGYWQVEMKEADKAKTAFQVGSLHFYKCNQMPFGLCNAPAKFQRLMERFMGDLDFLVTQHISDRVFLGCTSYFCFAIL